MKGLSCGMILSLVVLALIGCAHKAEPPPATPAIPGGSKAGMGSMAGLATDSPLVGTKAKDFTLPAVAGKDFTLAKALPDHFVLIYFYKGGW